MTDASTIAAEILRLLSEVKSGSLAVFGDIFGDASTTSTSSFQRECLGSPAV
jgi:hypothetical protein